LLLSSALFLQTIFFGGGGLLSSGNFVLWL
jgi:hypothetical protein